MVIIGSGAYIGMIIMIASGILLPVGVSIWWLVTRKEKISTILIGAATWFVFAIILETIPKAILLNPATSLGQTVMGSVLLYTVIGALLAGIFEETGRYVVFRTLLKNRRNRETGISHGIGHGGFEALYILVLTGVQYLIYASMINAGTFQSLVDQTAALGVDVSSLDALPAQIAAITPGTGLLSLFERVFAMLLHVSLSMLVFYGVRKSKLWVFFLAIAAHALFDVPAALYQIGAMHLYVTEALLAIYSIAAFVLVYRFCYQGLKEEREEAPAEAVVEE